MGPDLPVAFLLGAPRSGTSLVYKGLCLHQEAAWISNWVRRWPGAPPLAMLNRVAARAPRMQREVWFGSDSNAYVYGRTRLLKERVFPMPVEGEPVFVRSTGPAGAGEEDPALNLRRALGAIGKWAGGRVFVNKRIGNNRRIPLLLEAFPKARFVEIVRDGRAVAYSLSRVNWWLDDTVWWYGGTPRRWEAEGGDPWELCARSWVEETGAIEAGRGAVPPAQVLRMKYEAFLEDPLGSFGEVGSFCGLGEDPGWMDRLRELSYPNRNETWSRALDDAQITTIERIQGPTLGRYGYALHDRRFE